MHGTFTVIWGDRDIVYEGEVRDNHLEGPGVMTFKSGAIEKIQGEWSNDKLVKSNMLTMRDGSTATNYVYNYQTEVGLLTGKGAVKVGHSTYTGVWDSNGKLNGEGSIVNDND